MRMSPKISEKPDESRNRRPPRAMLLTAKVSHKLMWPRLGRLARSAYTSRAAQRHARKLPPSRAHVLVLEVLCRRIVACVDRVRQKLALVVVPKLAHVLIGLEHRV